MKKGAYLIVPFERFVITCTMDSTEREKYLNGGEIDNNKLMTAQTIPNGYMLQNIFVDLENGEIAIRVMPKE